MVRFKHKVNKLLLRVLKLGVLQLGVLKLGVLQLGVLQLGVLQLEGGCVSGIQSLHSLVMCYKGLNNIP